MSRKKSAGCFQLKGGNVTSIILELTEYPSPHFIEQLRARVQQAPSLFQQSAIVISLEKLAPTALFVDLNALIRECRDANLQPMAFKGGGEIYTAAIRETGLPWLPAGGGRSQAIELDDKPAPEPPAAVAEKIVARPGKLITRPVRGGQQIYAEGSDLIVLAQVSEGAEVLADGHVHIYGPLRGRALAGAKGDQKARVFCQQLEAELVSIAGLFVLSEDLRQQGWKQPAQIFIQDNKLTLSALN